jgi:hypothetical protein
MLDVVDRVLYEAIMQRLGPVVDRTLSAEVYSARLRETKSGGGAQSNKFQQG